MKLLIMLIWAFVVTGCASLNPLSPPNITSGFQERALEINEAYNDEQNAQVLKNILRARDRQGRKYTTLSELKLTPGTSNTNTVSAGEVGLGNNVGDPWIMLGGSAVFANSQNLELTVSPNVKGSDSSSVYRNPISQTQFNYYMSSGWPKDIVAELMVGSLEKLANDNASKTVLDGILNQFRPYRSYLVGDTIYFCFSETDCRFEEMQPKPKASSDKGSDKKDDKDAKTPTFIQMDKTISRTKMARLGSRNTDVSLDELVTYGGSFIYCRQESLNTPTKLGDSKEFFLSDGYRCGANPLPSTVCLKTDKDGKCTNAKTLTTSVFFVAKRNSGTVGTPDLDGIYTIQLNSIDDMIYTIGKSIRPQTDNAVVLCPIGANSCARTTPVRFKSPKSTDTTPPVNVPLFSISTPEDLREESLEACGHYFSARVSHHGRVYLAGPPQNYNYHRTAKDCHFSDRSSTVLTLISEMIELNQVPAKLTSSSIFVRN